MEINKTKFIFNKNKAKKIFVSLLAVATMLTSATPALADIQVNIPPVIYQRQNLTPISSGVSHEHIQRFTTLGWWNINVLRVDLNDPYTDIQGMFNSKGISSRDKVSSMVDKTNALAGINGDFFNYTPLPASLGPLINNGEIISSRADHATPLPGVFIDLLNNAEINYLNRETIATNLNTGDIITAGLINSLMSDFSMPIVLTPKWGEKSIGNKYRSDLVEVTVVDHKVTNIRKGQEATTIPENGYILVGRGEFGEKMMNFSIGDPIAFSINSNIDIKDMKFAIGGGSYILKDGQLNKSDLAIAGNHPRTGIGISRDGKELLLVTIDGRGTSFKGVSQELFATILKDLGAYNAINLDGGGSTTMAIKPLGKEKSQVVNTPSEGGERQVVNGVGVYSNAPVDKISYLKVSTIDNKMFPNTHRKIQVEGYDKYHNSIEVDPYKLSFHYDGDKGKMTENIYKALLPGNTKITAKYENILGEINLKILDGPVDITTNTSSLYLDKNSQVSLPIFYGKDANGVSINISPEDLDYEITNDIGIIENNVFTSNNRTNAGLLTARLGTGLENIKVYVGNSEALINAFDSLYNIKFSSYPDLVTGSISQDLDAKVGDSSLKLQYNLGGGEMTRAAYIDFLDNEGQGLSLNGVPSKLGLWVKGDNSGSWLRGSLLDSKGKEHAIDFEKSVNWTGWEFRTANLPNNISYPVTLKRIYVVETDPLKGSIGEISIDGLTGFYPPNLGIVQIPTPSAFTDSLNVKKEVEKNGFSFAVTMEPKGINELMKYDALSQIRKVAGKKDLSIFLNGLSEEFADTLKGKALFDASGAYKVQQFKNSLFIHLNTISKGIRETDFKQWNHMFYSVNTINSDNIFLLLDSPVWGSNGFTDVLEAELLHEYLLDKKENDQNIFVIHGGNSNTSLLKDGIRYLELDTRTITKAENIYNLSSIDFVVNGSDITYQINPVFNK